MFVSHTEISLWGMGGSQREGRWERRKVKARKGERNERRKITKERKGEGCGKSKEQVQRSRSLSIIFR